VANQIYYVTGHDVGDFPVTDGRPFGGQSDAFLAIVNFEGMMGYCRYFGGAEVDQVRESRSTLSNLYIAGSRVRQISGSKCHPALQRQR
jgi:hypothetical protein